VSGNSSLVDDSGWDLQSNCCCGRYAVGWASFKMKDGTISALNLVYGNSKTDRTFTCDSGNGRKN